jgi:AcrR family transcriptional regulator
VKAKKKLTAADRREQLIAVGCAVFAKRGYEATSMEEVAREAGVTKPVVYEHFGGKEGLYAVVLDREIAALVERVSHGIAQGGPRERFQGAVAAFLRYVEDHPDGFAVLTRDPPREEMRSGVTQVVTNLSERVGSVFAQEMKKLGFNPKTSALYANGLIGMVTQVGHWWVENPSMPVDDVARHVVALGWMGLRHLPKDPR